MKSVDYMLPLRRRASLGAVRRSGGRNQIPIVDSHCQSARRSVGEEMKAMSPLPLARASPSYDRRGASGRLLRQVGDLTGLYDPGLPAPEIFPLRCLLNDVPVA